MKIMKSLFLIASLFLTACGHFDKFALDEVFSDPQAIELCKAIQTGNTEKIDQLLKEGIDINTVGRDGLNPLLWLFLKNGETENKKISFKHLLKKGADPLEIYTPLNLTLFHLTAGYADPDYLKMILETDPNIDINLEIKDQMFSTPLLQALAAHQYANFKLLLDHGANIEKKRWNGNTPLMMSAGNGTWKFAYLLLQRNADYNYAKNRLLWTLENLVYHPSVSIEIDGTDYRQKVIDFLREKGVEVNPWMPEDEVFSD